MCGRYYSRFEKQQIAERFHVRRGLEDVGPIVPNYNVAPETFQPVIRGSRENPREHELVLMRWAIVPWFAKREDEFKALSTINAKSDRLEDSKMWREPFAKRRCLVPATGLYEWPKPGHAISPTYIPNDSPTAVGSSEPGEPSNLFGTPKAPAKRKKVAKQIKRLFNITMDDEATPFAFASPYGLHADEDDACQPRRRQLAQQWQRNATAELRYPRCSQWRQTLFLRC
jgi:hypothetical protein